MDFESVFDNTVAKTRPELCLDGAFRGAGFGLAGVGEVLRARALLNAVLEAGAGELLRAAILGAGEVLRTIILEPYTSKNLSIKSVYNFFLNVLVKIINRIKHNE